MSEIETTTTQGDKMTDIRNIFGASGKNNRGKSSDVSK